MRLRDNKDAEKILDDLKLKKSHWNSDWTKISFHKMKGKIIIGRDGQTAMTDYSTGMAVWLTHTENEKGTLNATPTHGTQCHATKHNVGIEQSRNRPRGDWTHALRKKTRAACAVSWIERTHLDAWDTRPSKPRNEVWPWPVRLNFWMPYEVLPVHQARYYACGKPNNIQKKKKCKQTVYKWFSRTSASTALRDYSAINSWRGFWNATNSNEHAHCK